MSRREVIGPEGVAVKLVERPGGLVTAKAELEDLRAQAQGQPAREALRRRVEAAVLAEDDDGRG